jgi:hypothetical protein
VHWKRCSTPDGSAQRRLSMATLQAFTEGCKQQGAAEQLANAEGAELAGGAAAQRCHRANSSGAAREAAAAAELGCAKPGAGCNPPRYTPLAAARLSTGLHNTSASVSASFTRPAEYRCPINKARLILPWRVLCCSHVTCWLKFNRYCHASWRWRGSLSFPPSQQYC